MKIKNKTQRIKKCNTCYCYKFIDQYYRDKSRPDGFSYKCKQCHKDYFKQEDKVEQYKQWRRGYYSRPEVATKVKKWSRNYYDNVMNSGATLAMYTDYYVGSINFCEEVRRDPGNENLLQVRCKEDGCRKWLNPTIGQVISRIGSLHTGSGECNFYCSDKCKEICPIFGQKNYKKGSRIIDNDRPEQNDLRLMVLERDDYECQICGEKEGLIAHHMEGIY